MKTVRHQMVLAMTGLFLTGCTVMAADVPAASAPPAIPSEIKLMQTGAIPPLAEQDKPGTAAHTNPAKGPVTEAPAGTVVPVTGFTRKDSGRMVTLTAGNRPAALFITSSVAGSANTAYADFVKKAYASYGGQMNFFIVQNGRSDKLEGWLKTEALPFPIIAPVCID